MLPTRPFRHCVALELHLLSPEGYPDLLMAEDLYLQAAYANRYRDFVPRQKENRQIILQHHEVSDRITHIASERNAG
ncbi:MAG: hypothetical protein QG605_1312 [Euryarchaeota archaeon]|nr:hypothetical protein [Euryarchaeota archaeon]